MPKQYEAIRDKMAKGAKKGSPAYDEAQSRAAAIYVGAGKSKKARSQRAKTLHEGVRATVDKAKRG
jgi:hypothetical protein